MNTFKSPLFQITSLILITLLLTGLACSLPQISMAPQNTNEAKLTELPPTQEDSNLTQPPEGTEPKLSDRILTEVAATIYADVTALASRELIQNTETVQETTTPSDLPQQPTSPANNKVTQTTSPTKQLDITEQPGDTSGTQTSSTHTQIPTLVGYTPFAPSASLIWKTPAFTVKNVNLHLCNVGYAAIFKIYSTSPIALESSSLQFTDRNTNNILIGPSQSDLPFISTDKTCNFIGSDSLYLGQTRYIGNYLGSKGLSLHTIQATIKLCTKEDLSGNCYTAFLEFVVP